MPKLERNRIKFYLITMVLLPLIIFGFLAFLFLRPEYNMSGVTFNDSTVVYDTNEHSIEISGNLPNGVSVSYYYEGEKLTGKIDAGTYLVTAKFKGNIWHQAISSMTATLLIEQADYGNIDGLELNDLTVDYDGTEHSIEIEGTIPSDFSVSYTYNGEDSTGEVKAGVYNVIATLTHSSGNYNDITYTATLTIEGVDLSDSVSLSSDTVDYDGYSHSIEVDSVPDSFSVSYTYNEEEVDEVTDVGIYTVIATFTSTNLNYVDFTVTSTLTITYTTDYEFDTTDETASLTLYVGSESDIKVPIKVADENGNVYTVESIDDYCFAGTYEDNNTSITDVEINGDIVSIGDYAFYYCTKLGSITFNSNIESIGSYCFWFCTSLSKIVIPDKVTSLSDSCFYSCYSLKSVTFNSNLESIEEYCFYYCTSLASVKLYSNLKTIGDYAFRVCRALEIVVLPDTLTSLGTFTFSDCDEIGSITLPASLTEMDAYCFYSCNELASVEILAKLETINNNVFDSCYNLTNITLPDTITILGDKAFYNSGLESITLPASLESIGKQCFYRCESLEKIIFEDTSSWYTSVNENGTDNLINVTSSTRNATYLVETYYNYYWTKS